MQTGCQFRHCTWPQLFPCNHLRIALCKMLLTMVVLVPTCSQWSSHLWYIQGLLKAKRRRHRSMLLYHCLRSSRFASRPDHAPGKGNRCTWVVGLELVWEPQRTPDQQSTHIHPGTPSAGCCEVSKPCTHFCPGSRRSGCECNCPCLQMMGRSNMGSHRKKA